MQDLFAVKYSLLIPLLPLLGAAIAGFFGARWLKGKSHWPIWLGVGASAVISISLLFGMLGILKSIPERGLTEHGKVDETYAGAPSAADPHVLTATATCFTWIHAGDFHIDWGYFFDPLTAVMLCVVCGVGLLICIFAAGSVRAQEPPMPPHVHATEPSAAWTWTTDGGAFFGSNAQQRWPQLFAGYSPRWQPDLGSINHGTRGTICQNTGSDWS